MFKFREPSFVEYLLYDLERLREKGCREQFVICLQFLEESPRLDSLMLNDAEKLVREFTDFLAGKSKVIPLRTV